MLKSISFYVVVKLQKKTFQEVTIQKIMTIKQRLFSSNLETLREHVKIQISDNYH